MSRTIKLPFGGTVVHVGPGSTEDAEKIIERRHEVVLAYCKKMGWPADPKQLTIEQILEIRDQPEWKNAGDDAG